MWAGRIAAREIFWLSTALLVYVYLGYPLLLRVVHPLALRTIRKGPIEPTVCLFVTAHNEAGVIEAKLRNSLQVRYPRGKLSIVVASDGSDDGTNEIVKTFAAQGVRLLEYSPRRGKVSAINDGLSVITG